jgi:putative nucleotidyltransferase with HDIG domain
MAITVPRFRSSTKFLPHAVVATFAVVVLPALAVSFMETSGRPWLLLASVLLAMLLSVAAASAGAALWARRPNSRDLVFGDLMLWGWLRRVRAERRLAEAQGLLGSGIGGMDGPQLSHERRCKILQRMAAMLEAKDPYTLGHSRRVTRHAERIAREMGLSREDVARIRIAASVHDIGKVHTPRQILTKPARLTTEELAVMKRHPADGAQMVAEMGDPEITAMVLHHHERLDGSGYPEGLRGDQIPLGARIISVADTFDAITSGRAYHGPRKHRPALEVVSDEAGSRLDPEAVAAFLRYYSGKRAVAWSALGLTGPPRLVNWLGGLLNSVGGWASPLTQSFAAITAAALAGVSLGGQPAPATAAGDQASQGASDSGGDASDRSDVPGGGLADNTPRGRLAPVSDRPGNRPQPDAPGGGSPGGSAPPGDGTAPGGPSPLPGDEPPGGELPGGDPPDVELPDVRPPDVQVPDVQVPSVELPPIEVPRLGLPSVELPPIELPSVEVPPIELPSVEVPLSRLLPGSEDVDVELPRLRLPTIAPE